MRLALISILCLFMITCKTQTDCSAADISCNPIGMLLVYARVPVAKYVYVTNTAAALITAFNVNSSTGDLTPASQTFSSGGSSPAGIAVDSNGQYLYVVNGTLNVSSFRINAGDGTLVNLGNNASNLVGPQGVAVDPSGRYVYVTNFGGSTVAAFASSAGVLIANGTGATTGFGPRRMAMDPLGRFLFIGGSSNTTEAFTISASGALTGNVSEPATAGGRYGVAVDATGSYVFAVDINNGNIRELIVNQSTGAFTLQTTINTGTSPEDIVIDQSNKFVYVANSASAFISMYQIGAGGLLSALSPATLSLPANSIRLALERPGGRFLYAVLSNSTIAILRVQSNGQLSLTNTISSGSAADSIAIASLPDYVINPSW